MALKKLSEYLSTERFEGKESARMHLAYRKAMQKPLFNLLAFGTPRDIDPAGVDGSELVKISYVDELGKAKVRKIGLNGEPLNVVRKTETVEMSALNRTFQIDRRQFKSASEATDVIKDNMDDATLGVCDALLQNILKGKKGTDDLTWNGLDYYFDGGNALNGMVVTTDLELQGGIVDRAAAHKFGAHLRKAINGMGVNKPTAVITTTAGLELIQAYNQETNVGIKYIKVGDVDYHEFMGLTVCDLPDGYFDPTKIATNKVPFYFVRLTADKTGFVIITKDGQIFDPITPTMTGNGRVYEGSNEMVCVPVPCTTECAAFCSVTVPNP